jgi:hypothetical protein
LIYKNGDFYEGEFNLGKQEGYGRFMAAENFLFEGYWKQGLYEGKGKLVYCSGIYIEGIF